MRKIDYNQLSGYDLKVMESLSRCIRKYGLKRTRMDDVAHFANVTRISLYRHYGNRNRLINCFLSYRSHQFHDRVRHRIKRCNTLESAIETYILSAILLAAKDDSVRELVDVHHVLEDALKVDNSEIKEDILRFWQPFFLKLARSNNNISNANLQELVDWLILVESSLILVVTVAHWDKKRVTSIIKNYVIPAFGKY